MLRCDICQKTFSYASRFFRQLRTVNYDPDFEGNSNLCSKCFDRKMEMDELLHSVSGFTLLFMMLILCYLFIFDII